MTWLQNERLAQRYHEGWQRERRRLVRTAISFAAVGVLVAAAVVTMLVRCL